MIKESDADKKTSLNKNSNNSDKEFQKILVENFVSLQKVLTVLSEKFDKLTKRLDGMIDLFEESAKTVVKGELSSVEETKHTEKVLGKMDKLFEQNKLIARGLTLMNEFSSNTSLGNFDSSPDIEDSLAHLSLPKKNPGPVIKPALQIPKKPEPKKPEPLPKDEYGFEIPRPTRRVFEEGSEESPQVNIPNSPPFRDL